MYPRMATGLLTWASPPLGLSRATMMLARLIRLDSILFVDHFQGLIPRAIWDREFTWAASHLASPHELFEYQVLLGYLARSAGRLRLGVGVTEPARRHPVLIAQAMLTLAHLSRHAPILGIGAGERENIEPYGLDFSQPVGRLEEALKIIRLCFSSTGPIYFTGRHYHIDGAVMALRPPKGRTPHIWIAGHGPRMLRLTGQYGDGWFPTLVASPEEYRVKLETVKTAAQEVGRDAASVTPALHQFVAIAATEREAKAMLQSRPARFAALVSTGAAAWRELGAEHPFGEYFRGYIDFIPEHYSRQELDQAMAAVPQDLIGRGWVVGTPEQVAFRLREFGAAGARHVVLSLSSALFSRRAAIYSHMALGRIAWRLRSGR